MSTVTPNLGLFKYNTSTDANSAFNINTALNNNWDIIDEALAGGGGSSRNIGEIVASTIPLTDAGLHLLDGALIDGNGIYSDFVDYIADIYDNAELGRGDLIKLPTFTSNTQDGITISDSRNNTTVLQDIFNGASTWSQIGAWSTYWINIDYNEPTYINYYSIQADSNVDAEYPSAWTLQASNDGFNWSTINTQTGITFTTGEYKNFYVNSNVTYKQYRIVFSNGVEASGNGELQRVSFNVNSQSKICFTTEEQWQNSNTQYGVCGKFVYNSTNNTVRLPKITGIIEGTTDLTALGDLVEAGLPNITGGFNGNELWDDNFYTTGCFTQNSGVSRQTGGGGDSSQSGIGFDASLSNSIYGNSNTVQPQTIKAFYYIVIATSTKTNIQVDIDEIATDLNSKVDKSDLQEVQCVVETYQNGTSWYRVYSDGWCEQGGYITSDGNVTFLKPYINTNYNLVFGSLNSGSNGVPRGSRNDGNSFTYSSANVANTSCSWQASGYIEV